MLCPASFWNASAALLSTIVKPNIYILQHRTYFIKVKESLPCRFLTYLIIDSLSDKVLTWNFFSCMSYFLDLKHLKDMGCILFLCGPTSSEFSKLWDT